jgi:hypothetical protein
MKRNYEKTRKRLEVEGIVVEDTIWRIGFKAFGWHGGYGSAFDSDTPILEAEWFGLALCIVTSGRPRCMRGSKEV